MFQGGMRDYLLPQTTLSNCTNLEGYGTGGQLNICFQSVPKNIPVQPQQICSLLTMATKYYGGFEMNLRYDIFNIFQSTIWLGRPSETIRITGS
jgi:hypothetical protein